MNPAAPHAYTCPKTGLRIIHSTLHGYRIATREWGPVNPRPHTDEPTASRADWSRYDTTGATIYLADTEEVAFAEMLAPYARRLGAHDALSKDAEALGMTLQDLIAAISQEWDEQSFLQQGHLPSSWRTRRELYEAETRTPGPWVDIEHPDSIAALRRNLGDDLHRDTALSALTVADLRGEDREVTTRIAEWVKKQTTADGTSPYGITFGSKHGGGQCWAYWSRGGRPDALITITASTPLEAHRQALLTVAERFGITIW